MNHIESDFFSTCPISGDQHAGEHILVDFWGVERMDDLGFIQQAVEESALKCGAVVLHSHYHPFGENMGISGMTLLAECHISIHTWPERSFASLDIFMCGKCNPQIALDHLINVMNPKKIDHSIHRRGFIPYKATATG